MVVHEVPEKANTNAASTLQILKSILKSSNITTIYITDMKVIRYPESDSVNYSKHKSDKRMKGDQLVVTTGK